MLPDQTYAEHEVRLGLGDVFVLFTDGVTEATGPGHVDPEELEDPDLAETNFFEEERLIEVVRASRGRSATEIQRAILREVEQFTKGIPQSDDITLLVLRRTA
jgi:serine phosphatase RsbU (regulator of sigma subunit)